jgi:hypothetical protein
LVVSEQSAALAAPTPPDFSRPWLGREPWDRGDFWRQPDFRIGRFAFLRRRTWDETVEHTRSRLGNAFETCGVDAAQRLACAGGVKTALILAFEQRSSVASRQSMAKLIAGTAGVATGAGLALLAYLRWQLTPALWLLAAVVAQILYFLGTDFLAKYVFPGVLHWGFGVPRWSHTARLYARTVIYLTAGLISLLAVLTLADRHHHLTTVEKVLIASPLGGLAAVVGLWAAVGAQSISTWTRRPADPYPELIIALLDTYVLQHGMFEYEELAVRSRLRFELAGLLARPARAMLTDCAMTARFDQSFSPAVTAALAAEGAKVANWLHETQRLILSPSAADDHTACQRLGDGFLAASCQDWAAVQADAPAGAPGAETGAAGKTDAVARWAPRIIVTVFLLVAAFLIPDLLGNTLTGAARTTLTVSLILTALTALATPSQAVSTVASNVSAAKTSDPTGAHVSTRS